MDELKEPRGKKTVIDDQEGWVVIHTIKGHQYNYLHIYDPETKKTNKIKYLGPVKQK